MSAAIFGIAFSTYCYIDPKAFAALLSHFLVISLARYHVIYVMGRWSFTLTRLFSLLVVCFLLSSFERLVSRDPDLSRLQLWPSLSWPSWPSWPWVGKRARWDDGEKGRAIGEPRIPEHWFFVEGKKEKKRQKFLLGGG